MFDTKRYKNVCTELSAGTQPSSHVKCVKTVLDNTTSTLPYSVNLQKLDLPPSPFKYKEEVEIQPGLDYNDTRSDPDPVICSMVVSNSPEVSQISPATAHPPNLTSFSPSFLRSSETSAKLYAGIMYRKKQKILVVRHALTSFTTATFVTDKTINELKDGLLLCCLPLQLPQSTVYVDCSSELQNLISVKSLFKHNMVLNIGQVKNKDETLIFKQVNQELELELFKVDPSGNPVSAIDLLNAVHSLNSHIQSNGFSSKEMLSRHLSNRKHTRHTPPCTMSCGSLLFFENESSLYLPRQSSIQSVSKNKVPLRKSTRRKENVTAPRSSYLSDYDCYEIGDPYSSGSDR